MDNISFYKTLDTCHNMWYTVYKAIYMTILVIDYLSLLKKQYYFNICTK